MSIHFTSFYFAVKFGELASVLFEKGNKADNNGSLMRKLFKRLKGLVFADKGSIDGAVAEEFLGKGLRLMTKVKKHMKNRLLEMGHKVLLMKRGIIECVNDILKTVCDIDHSHHRSPANMLVNTFAALIAYATLERKPPIFY